MYNTRRGGGYGRGGGMPGNNMGQRRSMQGNFVPASQQPRTNNQGPQTPQTPQRQNQNQNQQRNDTPVKNLQKTAEATINEQKIQEAKKDVPVQKQNPTPQPVPSPVKKESPVKPKVEKPAEVTLVAPPPPPVLSAPSEETETTEEVNNEEEAMDTSGDAKPRPPWMKKNKGKISKAEKVKRRNMRLRKIMQPKNALMVLNEIAGATAYELNEIQPNTMYCGTVQANFKATVTVDGQIHEGYGKNKPAAKTAAAEAALKYLVLTRLSSGGGGGGGEPAPASEEDVKPGVNAEESNGEKMEVEEKEDDISYCHLASFALYKLFSSWDDGGKIMSRSNSHTNLSTSSISGDSMKINQPQKNPPEMRPSKKMPEHPEQMNPVMLLNQMYPNAVYEEVCKTGSPPKIVFTMKCTIDGKSFIGNGQNKKCARREAAFHACKELLGVEYPEEN